VFTVTVTDNGGTANDGKNTKTMSFEVAVSKVNTLPTITFQEGVTVTNIARNLTQGQNTGVIPFFVGDAPNETPVERLVVTPTSSNPSLIPNTTANMLLSGSGSTRGIVITPAAGQSGSAVVTLTVTDLEGGSRIATIDVTVAPGENPAITASPSSETISVNQFSSLISLNVSDAQTPADALKIGWQDADLVSSDNPSLVPASPSNIQFGGTGASRAMIILPRPDQSGVANITLKVKDASGNLGSTVFKLTVLGSPPTISTPVPSSVNVDVGRTSPAVTVTVNDKETFPGFLIVTGKSSDTTVIPDSNIFALGNNTSRSVTVLAGSKAGTATITLTVTDAEGQTATTSFVVNVTDNNTAPTITPIGPQSTSKNRPSSPIPFVVGDAETPVASLTVAASSANTTLVPNANIVRVQSPSNPASWNLIITPATEQVGTALITVTVTDGGAKSSSRTFTLTVSAFAVANDLNKDGAQDIVLQDNGGFVAAWFMSGDDLKASSFFTPSNVGDLGWKGVGLGDFDGDGNTDLLFQHTDGSLAVWKLNGVTLLSSSFLNPANSGSPDWKAMATGDFNKDGKIDILFQHTDSRLAIWYMDRLNLGSVGMLKPEKVGLGWTAVGTGDINGDTNLDIVFQYTDGTLAVWYLIGGENLLLSGYLSPRNPGDANWRGVATLDLNGDTRTDVLLQNATDGSLAIWYMNKEKLILGKLLNPSKPGGTWKVVGP
jgi:hypothetical protein